MVEASHFAFSAGVIEAELADATALAGEHTPLRMSLGKRDTENLSNRADGQERDDPDGNGETQRQRSATRSLRHRWMKLHGPVDCTAQASCCETQSQAKSLLQTSRVPVVVTHLGTTATVSTVR